jgi:cytochrome d ubiquinol oxidase subunit II
VTGYAFLASAWLIMKAEGPLQVRARRMAKWLGAATLACIAVISAVTPLLAGQYYRHWFAWPKVLLTAQVPLLVAIGAVLFFRSLRKGSDYRPFLLALALFGLSFAGLGVSIFPDIVPGAVTIWQAASPVSSQLFMLVGTVVLVPIILAYTGYAYWVFRGKVGHEGYHE